MPDMPGRPDYWNIGYPLLGTLVYSLMLIGAVAIAYGLYKRWRMWRLGRPDPELGSWIERTRRFVTPAILDILVHRRFVRREVYAGLMHLFLFTGMIVLFGATVIDALESNFHHWLPWDFPTSRFRLQEGLVWDIFGGGFAAIGLGMALYRRYVLRPPRLNTVLDDGVVLSILGGLILTGFLVEGLRHAATLREPTSEFYAPGQAYWEPIGFVVSLIFAPLSRYATEWLHFWSWWFHAGLLAALFVYVALRFSKISHILISPANVYLRPLRAKGVLRPALAAAGSDGAGAADITDFTWKQLLDLDACTNCGRCEDSCPAWASAKVLSPRKLMQDLRAYMEERSAQPIGSNGNAPAPPRDMNRDAVTTRVLWSCTTCRACMEVCPVFISHVDAIVDMRRRLVYDGEMDAQLQSALENLGRYGNSFGQSGRRRGRWTQDLDVEVKDATKEPVEYLWFVGDYASYDAGLPDITRATARVFHMAGLDFGILYADERNAGNDARRVGEEGLFEEMVEQNA
ncbi:MAG: 4Fe-4S dicluster domain-containing protein, partial [Gemmatimonadetes bacterium]|nr:4Fe-4S dicluster domain-containing protein [Gemmatimonadota bacterium]